MKKYKIVKFKVKGETYYKLMERAFIFFLFDLGIVNETTFKVEIKVFHTREEANTALLDWLHIKNKKLIYYYG